MAVYYEEKQYEPQIETSVVQEASDEYPPSPYTSCVDVVLEQSEATGSSSGSNKDHGINKSIHRRDWLIQLLQKHAISTRNSSNKSDLLKHKALVVAPMVDQSDLPFRLLCRRYGANLCYTPMIHARMFVNNEQGYQRKFWNAKEGTPDEDRPLIVQFAGGDPSILVRAAKLVEHQCDAIDINCGCPQSIAKRGKYGAFLLEQEEQLVACVKALSEAVRCPVTIKVRLLPSGVEDSIKLYHKLIDAGASMLCIHGRHRLQKGRLTGAADWNAIQQVVNSCGDRVPIIANGSCASLDDLEECLRFTGADGVMLSEAVLEYPPVFSVSDSLGERPIGRTGPGRLQIAREYMALCNMYPPNRGGQGTGTKCVKMHLHRFLHADLQSSTELRDMACRAQTEEDMYEFIEKVHDYHQQIGHKVEHEKLSWYYRYRNPDARCLESSMLVDDSSNNFLTDTQFQLVDEGASFASCLFGTNDDDASY